MDKNAQNRSLLNKLREHANITGKILEGINPKFHKMMEDLRATDEKVRGYAEPAKELIKSARSLINRRDYLSAATNISMFHERCRYIAGELNKFINTIDQDSYEVLLNQFDDEQKERIFGYDPNKELNLNEVSFAADDMEVLASLEKKAGLADWWHNLTNERAVAMKALEKRFSISFLKDLKKNSETMFNESLRFLQFLLLTFKKLATALAKRKPSQYIDAAKEFTKKFASYHDAFVKFYEKNINPLKEQHQKMVEQTKGQSAQQFQQEQGMPTPSPSAPQMPSMESEPVINLTRPTPSPATKNKTLDILDRLRGGPMEELEDQNGGSKSLPLIQSSFIAKLETLANINDPKSMMLAILKYSEKIEDTDLETSLKLLAIAEGISDDINNAPAKKEDKKEEAKLPVPLN